MIHQCYKGENLMKIDLENDYTLLNGDCLNEMKNIPDESIDMVLTDPPYGMSLKPQRSTGKFYKKKIKNDDNLDWTEDFFKEMKRILKKDSACLLFCNHHCVSEFIYHAKQNGFEIKNLIVWDKGHFGMGGNWRPVHELILIITNGRFVCKSKNLRSIIEFKKLHHSKMVHPTEKPIDLLEHLLVEPDYDPIVILDPFMGSGSTGVACLNNNRKFIGIELDENYFNIAKTRIEEAFKNKEN